MNSHPLCQAGCDSGLMGEAGGEALQVIVIYSPVA